jgi:MoaA/NifB/PqqE/SkfB family radical SAM enzyme
MYPSRSSVIHIELTDKCQASCPMCARNINGGAERTFVGKHDISLNQFVSWFSQSFLSNVVNFYACGNYGDPIIAKDCLEIFDYVRKSNTECRLAIHTNGSARSTEWWTRLASVLGDHHMVTFGIDGFADSHVLYRRGTDWYKIIENARAFISAGGKAEIDCLVFKHNEHEIEDFKKQMLNLGFVKVNFKYTRRFYDMTVFPVEDKNGIFEYNLEPSTIEKPIQFIPLEEIGKDISIWEKNVQSSNVNPRCINNNEVFIDARGNVFPCCWIGSDLVEEPIVENLTIQKLRNLVVKNSKGKFSKYPVPNLNEVSIEDVVWYDFESFLKTEKPWTCVKNCNG